LTHSARILCIGDGYAGPMERVAWTDERLDELARRMDAGFERVDREIRELRSTMNRVGSGLIVGLAGVIAAVFLNGS
jgi:hypothetical protein